MNIHKFLYRHVWLLLLLLASCSQDEIVPNVGGTTGGLTSAGVAPISICMQSGADNEPTKAITEDDLYDDINEVQILVYRRDKGTQNDFELCSSESYIFSDKEGTAACSGGKIACTDGTPYRKAEAFFIPPAQEKENSEYRLYAFAYNTDRWTNVTLHLEGKKLFYLDNIEMTDGIPKKSIEESGFAYMELVNNDYSRLDFFAGSVGYDFGEDGSGLTEAEKEMYAADYIDGNTSRKLAGKLRRATGRLSFHLTDIPAEYDKICLVVDGYTTQSLIGLGERWWSHKQYEIGETKEEEEAPWLYEVFGYGWDMQTGDPEKSDTWVTVAEADLSGGQTSADLYMDCLPAMGFKVYVQPYKDGKVAGTYRIHCAAKEYYPGYVGIMDWVVDDEGRFTVMVNNWAKLEGEFNRLDNMKIDLGWGDDYQGPVLGQD